MLDHNTLLAVLLPQLLYLLPNVFLLIAALYFRKSTGLAGSVMIIIGIILYIGLTLSGAATSMMFMMNVGNNLTTTAAIMGGINMLLGLTGTVLIGAGLISCANDFKRRNLGGPF